MRKAGENSPIGVFDSGVGGLTVARAIIEELPGEQILYFGDTAHLPYGDKSADAICYYSLRIARFLLEKGCKMIVVACNSASTAAYHVLLEFFGSDSLFVNVVDPLVHEVAGGGHQNIGIIATKATVHSGIYQMKLETLIPDATVKAMATPLLVPMIEEGYVDNDLSRAIIGNYLNAPVMGNIDALLLACTHYPVIRSYIEKYYGGKVGVYDSTKVVAKAVREQLTRHNLLNSANSGTADIQHTFYVSEYTPSFEETANTFYSKPFELIHYPIWS